jgi:hypothetical protein
LPDVFVALQKEHIFAAIASIDLHFSWVLL